MSNQNKGFKVIVNGKPQNFQIPPWIIGLLFALVVLLGVLSTSFYTIAPEEEGVKLRFGVPNEEILQPGLGFKLPFGIEDVIKVPAKRNQRLDFGAATSAKDFDEALILTGDLNVAEVGWSIIYSIKNPKEYIFAAKEPIQTLRDVSITVMRRVIGDKPITNAMTEGRTQIANEVKLYMEQMLENYKIGIRVEAVQLQLVLAPEIVRPAFDDVNSATQERQRMVNEAEQKKNRVIPEAKGQAEKDILNAQGKGTAILNRADGDVLRFKKVLEEYSKAPEITRKRLYLEAMSELMNKIHNITIVDENAKGVLPVYGSTPVIPSESVTKP